MAEQSNRAKRGFTLIEILVTTAIIGLLIGIVLGISGLASKKSDDTRAIADMQKISNALEAYRVAYGTYPLNLNALTDPNAIYDFDVRDFRVTDPWGNPYLYERDAQTRASFKLRSTGPKLTDDSDDIYSTMGTY